MIKYEFRCEICQSKFDSNYNTPKVLICGHTICSKCVDRMKEKKILRCPFDRKQIDFDDDKIANNFYILSLIDGSIKESITLNDTEVEEDFAISAKPVINNPGWKNTLDGFIREDILYTVESNGFFYCTDLNTGEWWFLYLNQFWGKFYFQVPITKKMFMIDHYGNLYQIFNKNYYTQIGKKNSWMNTTHVCVLNQKLYSLESTNKLYETNLNNGKWKEVGVKNAEEDSDEENLENIESDSNNTESFYNFNFAGINIPIPNVLKMNLALKTESLIKTTQISRESNIKIKDIIMMISTGKNILVANNKGELIIVNETTGETFLLSSDFPKNLESYSNNSNHIYYFEKGCNTIYRINIPSEEINEIFNHKVNFRNNKQKIHYNTAVISSKNEFYQKLENNKLNNTFNENPEINFNNAISNHIKSIPEFILTKEKFIELEENIIPIKLIVNNNRLVVTDKKGELTTFKIDDKCSKKFQCLFMLRNCHIHNTILVGDGDLLILDPIRLSLNKLNIITGSEVIILHSMKFLSTIKYIFSANSKIYFIDSTGSLFHFLEGEKKISQVGNNGICKYLIDFAISKNFIFTIENNSLYKTNLIDGNFTEIKNSFPSNYKYFFADNANLVFINKDDEIIIVKPDDTLKLKKKLYYKNISNMNTIAFFKNHLVFYNNEKRNIEALNLDREPTLEKQNDHNSKDVFWKVLIENFPEVTLFINNNDCLACILKDGVIYKLHC